MVERLLQELQEEGAITGFVHHGANSDEDRDGMDFTVSASIKGAELTRSFGVTISRRSWNESSARHPHVPQFCFPIGTKPDTMTKRILGLFV